MIVIVNWCFMPSQVMKGNSDNKLVFYALSGHERWGLAQDNASLGSYRLWRSRRLTSLDCHCIRLGKVGGGEGGREKGGRGARERKKGEWEGSWEERGREE